MTIWVFSFVAVFLIVNLSGSFYFLRYSKKMDLAPFREVTIQHITHSIVPSRVSPELLLAYRSAYLCFAVAIQIHVFYVNGTSSLAYFTIWNYMLQIAYFALTVYISLWAMIGGQKADSPPPKILGKLVYAINEINTPIVMLVALILWTLLLPAAMHNDEEDQILNFDSYAQHALNVPAILIEFFLNRMYIHFTHVPIVIVWSSVYALFAIIFRNCSGGFDPYFFTNTDHPLSLLFMGIVLFAVLIAFIVALKLSQLKAKWFSNPDYDNLQQPIIGADSISSAL
jgi:uncharacterized integral membrane protein